MNYEDLWPIPVVILVAVCILFLIVLTEREDMASEREAVCVINGYDFVAYNSGNYYCIGYGTSKLIIRQNDKYELR